MCRCGLENNGHPGTDKFINNVGDEAEMELTLHGKIANIPASHVEVEVEQSPPYRIHLKGVVHETTFHGPKLTLATDLSTEPGSDSLRITDTVTNASASPQEVQLIYHTNYGRPLLEEGARFEVAILVKRIAAPGGPVQRACGGRGRIRAWMSPWFAG